MKQQFICKVVSELASMTTGTISIPSCNSKNEKLYLKKCYANKSLELHEYFSRSSGALAPGDPIVWEKKLVYLVPRGNDRHSQQPPRASRPELAPNFDR